MRARSGSPDGALDVSRVGEDDVDEGLLEDVGVLDDVVGDVGLEVGLGLVHDALELVEEVVVLDTRFDLALDVGVNGHVGGDDASALGGLGDVGDLGHVGDLVGRGVEVGRGIGAECSIHGVRRKRMERGSGLCAAEFVEQAEILVDEGLGLDTEGARDLA